MENPNTVEQNMELLNKFARNILHNKYILNLYQDQKETFSNFINDNGT